MKDEGEVTKVDPSSVLVQQTLAYNKQVCEKEREAEANNHGMRKKQVGMREKQVDESHINDECVHGNNLTRVIYLTDVTYYAKLRIAYCNISLPVRLGGVDSAETRRCVRRRLVVMLGRCV